MPNQGDAHVFCPYQEMRASADVGKLSDMLCIEIKTCAICVAMLPLSPGVFVSCFALQYAGAVKHVF